MEVLSSRALLTNTGKHFFLTGSLLKKCIKSVKLQILN